MATPKQREMKKLRRYMYQLSLQGLTQAEIGEQLGYSSRQVFRHIEKIREKEYGQIEHDKKEKILQDLAAKQQARTKRLWGIVADNKATRNAVLKALAILGDEDDRSVKIYEKLGTLPKDTVPISVGTDSKDGIGYIPVQINITQQQKPQEIEEKTDDHKPEPESETKSDNTTEHPD